MNDPLEIREDRDSNQSVITPSRDSKVTIPLFDYNILVRKCQLLTDICAVASRDKLDYSYSSETSKTIDTLLGIERKEKAD